MVKKSNNKRNIIYSKSINRFRILLLVFIVFVVILLHSVFNDWMTIFHNIQEKNNLEIKLNNLVIEEERLNSEVIKLQDKEYVLLYAREKYGYSKDGELIIRINESEE